MKAWTHKGTVSPSKAQGQQGTTVDLNEVAKLPYNKRSAELAAELREYLSSGSPRARMKKRMEEK